VKRTFSDEPQFSTGLSGKKTLKADRQEVGDFSNTVFGPDVGAGRRIHRLVHCYQNGLDELAPAKGTAK
jgi:hypothetical protein